MLEPKSTPVRCSSCGVPSHAEIRSVIDTKHDPQGKILLISGQLNSFSCPNCGTLNNVKTPILYHDAEKELLVAFVPQEIGVQQKIDEEKMVGDLLNELTTALPKEEFRGYMFNPKRSLTLQGLINQILEADGITPEMLKAQQDRVDLIQTLMETDADKLIDVIKEHDDQIDDDFFGTFSTMGARLMQAGQPELANRLDQLQTALLEHSTTGQELVAQQIKQQETIEAVSQDIETLGQDAEKKDFIQLLWSYRDDEEKVQAMVGLIRPLFDYEFFQMLAGQVGNLDEADRPKLEALRDQVYQLTQTIDEQSKTMMQQLAGVLQTIASSPNPEQMIRENLGVIDDNFMMILNMNIQESQKRGDQETSARLQEIYEIVVSILREQMQPELRFVNDLLSIEDDTALINELKQQAPEFEDTLLEVLDAVEEIVTAQGQTDVVARLQFIRTETQKILS
jgi:hypothetical protein